MAFSDFQLNRTPLSHRICDKLELDEDICRNCGYIEIVSDCFALIDGCKGVSEYSENLITLSLGKKSVTFEGQNLTISSLSMEQAMVEGIIAKVEFS